MKKAMQQLKSKFDQLFKKDKDHSVKVNYKKSNHSTKQKDFVITEYRVYKKRVSW